MTAARRRLRAQWRELFKTYDAVICPIMPTPAYPHDHSRSGEAPHPIDGKASSIPTTCLARHRHAARPALDRDPDRLLAGRTAGRRADRRPRLEDRTPLKLAELIERDSAASAAADV